eukprot:CAMPEP_0182804880 /NCGR_PEP_ID=MMETSP0006_2-20121128/4782_1 /TAXON_ID=97485 /ORGANISM="Prymnesium parvum, Strain Texoma1" /LENGTH=45 /DNA_ID= /DNA_START= /DNA_END= /DNA_ORIENTATION=
MMPVESPMLSERAKVPWKSARPPSCRMISLSPCQTDSYSMIDPGD